MKKKLVLNKSIATLLATTVTLTSVFPALPEGERVKAGTATFDRSSVGTLNIRTSNHAIIDYRSFNIGAGEQVKFVQPNSQSVTLNRVTEANPTQIFGTLQANGHIVLANPYGIFFENGSLINVGGLIAAAGHITDSDFLAGRMNFTGLTGDVENRGGIIAVNDVGLYGAHVSNEGVITSQKASVTMGAGRSVYVGEAGGNIFVSAPSTIPKATLAAPAKPGVKNSGTIAAPKVTLATGDMYGMAIAQSGSIVSPDIMLNATGSGTVAVSGRVDASNLAPGKKGGKIRFAGSTIELRDAIVDASGDAGGGTILLDGGHNADTPTSVTSSGTITARGEGPAAGGGTVQMLGDHVGLLGSAIVDVSGGAGGGTALIGGDYQGKNPEVQNAVRTYISLDAQIRADALGSGDGGKVIVWADDVTRHYGSISVRGGEISGNGGFVEVSGKNSLVYAGLADRRAPNGFVGTLLLDPTNMTINNVADVRVNTPNGGPFDPSASGGSTLTWATITGVNGLGSGDLIVRTTSGANTGGQLGDITIAEGTTYTSNNSLTLNAAHNIVLSAAANITNNGSGNIIFTAVGTGSVSLGANVTTTNNGNISVTSGTGGVSQTAASTLNSNNGTITINGGGGAIQLNTGTLTTTNAGATAVDIQNATTVALGNVNAANGTLRLGTGDITGAVTQNAATLNVNTITANTTGSINLSTNSVSNLIGTLDSITRGGALTVADTAGGLTVTGPITGGTITNAVSITTAGGALAVNGQISASGNSVSLISDQAITQANTGAGITAGGLRAVNTSGNITLNPTGVAAADVNTVTTFAAAATAGNVSFKAAAGFAVGQVNPTNGITANGAGASVSLETTSGAITQSQIITTPTLNVTTANSNATLGATNLVGALGTVALGNGAFVFVDNTASLAVPAGIVADGGINITNTTGNLTTAAALGATGGNIILSAAAAGRTITLGGAVTASGNVSLTSGGLLDTGANLIQGTTGTVTLTSNSAGVTIGAGGLTAGTTASITAGGTDAITQAAAPNGTITAPGGITLTTGTGAIGGSGTPIHFAGGQTGVVGLTHGGDVFLTDTLGALTVTSVTTKGNAGAAGGDVTIDTTAGALAVGAIDSRGTADAAASDGFDGGKVTLTSSGVMTVSSIDSSGSDATVGPGNHNGGSAGDILLSAGAGAQTINVNGNLNASGGDRDGGGANFGTNGAVVFDGNVETADLITLSGGVIRFNNGLSPGGDAPGATGANLTINGNLTFVGTSTLIVTLNGLGAGTEFDRIVVNNRPNATDSTINLGNANLVGTAPFSYSANPAANLNIIRNNGGNAVNGTFLGLDGTTNTTITNQDFLVTYVSGSDNVRLTRVATEFTWDGGGSDNKWTTNGNWTVNAHPDGGDVLHFAGALRLTPNNDLPAGTVFKSIIFDAFDAATGVIPTGAFTLNGNGIGLTAGITNNSANTQTVNMPLTLTASQTFNAVTGALAFGASSSVDGVFTLTLSGGFNIGAVGARMPSTVTDMVDSMSGGTAFVAQTAVLNLSGVTTGGASIDLTNTFTTTLGGPFNVGAGTVTLAGPVTGAGLITASALTLNGAGDAGTSLLRLNTTVDFLVFGKTGGNAFINESNAVAVNGTGTGGTVDVVTATGDLTVNAALSNNGDISLRSTVGQVLLGGPVTSNNGGVTLQANGALDTGAFLVSAATAVTGDVTLISDTSTVTIGAGGVTVGDTLTIQIGPGLTLTIAGALTAPSVTLVADQMIIGAAITSTGAITLAPVTVGTNVTLGNATAPLVGLVIDNTELGFLASASALTIGKVGVNPTTANAILFGTATVGNQTLNLNANAGITQSDFGVTIGGGTGTLNIAAGGAVNLLGAGVAVGTISGGSTGGAFDVAASSAAGLTVNAITNAGGEVVITNNVGAITVADALDSNGQSVAVFTAGGLLSVNATITATGASVGLGGSAGITQGGGGVITAANLLAETLGAAGANVALDADNVVSGNVTLNAGGGNVSFTDTSAFTVGGIAAIVYPVAGSLTALLGPGIRTNAAGIATITAGGNVSQADILSTGTLNVARVAATNPNVMLGTVSNSVANLGTVAIGNGAFTLLNGANLAITGAGTAGGGYAVETAGTLTQNPGASINTSANNGTIALTATGAANDVTLNDVLDAGAGPVTLNAGGSVLQQVASNILAGAVTANSGVAGSVALNSAGNAFASITGSSGTGFSATDSQSLAVAAGGITNTSGLVNLTVLGAANDLTVGGPVLTGNPGSAVTLTSGRDIAVNDVVTATGVGSTLYLAATGSINEAPDGGVVSDNLRAVATTGLVSLAAGAFNNVTTLAGSANGSFDYTDPNSAALRIGTVVTTGVTSTTGGVSVLANAGTLNVNDAVQAATHITLISLGNLVIDATVTSTNGDIFGTSTNGTLDVNAPVTATSPGGDVTLTSAGQLSLTAGVDADNANGRVSLTSTGASIIATGVGGIVTGAELLANAFVNVDLARINNVGATGFAATATNGFVAFFNAGAITLDQVGGTNGVTAGGAVVLANLANDITQTANGIITAGAGLLMQGAGNILLDQANLVSGNLAVVFTPNGDITFRNTGAINVGTVGPVATVGGIGSFSGIGGGSGRFLSLISDAGAITQDSGPIDAVVTGDLRVQTAGANVTLTNAVNRIDSVGTVALDAGKLTLVDSALGLVVTGPINANGGVNITTKGGALTLPGNITVNAGDIVLRSTDQELSLGSVLSASGLVQLDAGGAGAITQIGGSINATSLIARAPGNVTLTQTGNDVTNLAGFSTVGTFSYRDATAVTVSTINDASLVPVAVSGLTTTNDDITVVGGAGLVSGGVAINSPVNAGGGIVRVQSETGDITQGAVIPPSTITSASLLANAVGGSVNLSGATNAVATSVAGFAGGTNGSFRFLNLGGINVDNVVGDAIATTANGILTNNGDVALLTGGTLTLNRPINTANGAADSAASSGTVRMLTTAGSITQTVTGPIVANGLLLNANGGVFFDVVPSTNDVITLAGRAGLAGFSYQDKNDVTVGNIGADGTGSFPGLLPPLAIAGVNSIDTTGPLTLTAAGVLNFSVPLIISGSLIANAPTIDINGGGNPTVQTVGGQTYNGAVVLTDDAVLLDLGAGAIRFLSTVDSDAAATPRALTINTDGNTEFNGLVGNVQALRSIFTDQGLTGSVRFNAAGSDAAPTVRTTTFQTYNDPVLLALNTALSSLGGGDVTFASTVNSEGAPRGLRVNSTGNEIFNGVVGGALTLLNLVTDGDAGIGVGGQTQFAMTAPGGANPAGVNAGSVIVNDTAFFNVSGSGTIAPSVQTSGGAPDAQSYNGAVLLSAGTMLADTAAANIVFNSTVNGAFALEVNTGGNEVFNGRVGDSAALASLIMDASNLGGNSVFNAAGTTAAPSVITTGFQTYNDDVTLGANVVLQSTGSGNLTFNRTVNGAFALEANTGGNEVFNGRVGDSAALASLIVDASNLGGNVVFNAAGTTAAPSVITTGVQTYNDDVTMGADLVLQSTGSGNLTFNRTVNGAFSLEANTGGNEVFNGRVGDSAALTSLIMDASNPGGNVVFNAAGTTAAPSVITTGFQTYNDDVTLGANVVLQSTTGGNLTFNGTINGAFSLEANAVGNEVFFRVVGGGTPLMSLTTDGDATLAGGQTQFNMTAPGGAINPAGVNAGRVTVNDVARFNVGGSSTANPSVQTGTGGGKAQRYNKGVLLNAPTVLKDIAGGNIVFVSTVNGAQSLEVDTAGNEVFKGVVGGVNALASLTTDKALVGGQTQFSMDVGSATAGVHTTGKVTVNDSVLFNATNVTDANPTVLTDGGQDYKMAARFAQDAILTDASGQPVTFRRQLNGLAGLKVNTSGDTTFKADIGVSVPLRSLETDALGKTILPAFVTTSGSQNYVDPVKLSADTTLTSTAAGNINLRSTVGSVTPGTPHSLTVMTKGGAAFGASFTDVNVFRPIVSRTTAIGTPGTTTKISVPTVLRFPGPVVVVGNVVLSTTTTGTTSLVLGSYDNSGSDLTFSKTVNGPGTLTVRAGGNLTFAGAVGGGTALEQLVATAPVIDLNSTQVEDLLLVNATTAPLSDGSDGLINLIGSIYSASSGDVFINAPHPEDPLYPAVRVPVSRHATILSTIGDVAISAAGEFFMGNGQKLLVNGGSLAITAGTSATVGDLAALTGLTVASPTINFQGRPPVDGLFNEHRQDSGLGFVAPTIRFVSTGGGLANIGFVPGTTTKVTFSTFNSIASVRQIAGVSIEVDKDQLLQFNGNRDVGAKDSNSGDPLASGLDLGVIQPIASGTRVTEPGDAKIVFVLETPKPIDLHQDTTISKAVQDTMKKMGIAPREATPDEIYTVSRRRGVYRQPIEGKAEMENADYRVVVNRLTTEEIKRITAKYLELAGEKGEKIGEIALSLAEQVAAYQAENPDAVGLDGFTKWLQTHRTTDKADKGEKEKAARADKLAESLDKLAKVFVDLERIGLTKKEIEICKSNICEDLNANQIVSDSSEILPLIEGGSKPPPKAPPPLPEPTIQPAIPPPASEPLMPAPFLPLPPFPEAGAGQPLEVSPGEPTPDGTMPPPPPPEGGSTPPANPLPDVPAPDAVNPQPPLPPAQ